MAWSEERKKLEVLSQLPTANSPFKKKLTIINRMKNITAESLPLILREIKSENLQKFSVEIVNSLLSNTKASTHEDVHNIVRIIYLYSYDRSFMMTFIAAAKKALSLSWVNGALLAEAHFQMNGQIDGLIQHLLSVSNENMPHLMNYIACNFENIDKTIIEKKTRELLENVTERNIEPLTSICVVLGWDIRLEADEGFVEVIKTEKDEFEFYRRASVEGAERLDSVAAACDLRLIDSDPYNTAVLSAIAAQASGNQEVIGRLIKKAKNVSLAPAVACVISQLSKGRSAAISQAFSGDYDSLTHHDLVLIGEMYKFNVLRLSDITGLLSFYFRNRNVEKLCILLENVGRYMLVRRDTNKFIRDFIGRLESFTWQELDKLRINDCLSKIYKLSGSEVDIIGFFRWALRRNTFYTYNLLEHVKSSKRLLYILFSLPELFEDESFLAELVGKIGMVDEMIEFYIISLEPMARCNRMRAYRMADALGSLSEGLDVALQAEILERVWGFNLSVDLRCNMILPLLEHSNRMLHGKYISILSWSGLSAEPRNRLFNFCEKYNYEELERESCEFDSFERELVDLRED